MLFMVARVFSFAVIRWKSSTISKDRLLQKFSSPIFRQVKIKGIALPQFRSHPKASLMLLHNAATEG
jgi:hypothetical protein